MGYYSEFKLEIISEDKGYNYEEDIVDFIDFNPFEDNCTWYSIERDMINYSKEYPNVLFKITRQGETITDRYCYYFQNGKSKSYETKVVFIEPPFDIKDLK